MVMVTTSIKIDNDKRDLAKKRGLILTNLLDEALDMALGLELKQSTQLQKEKEELLENKAILLKEKEDFLKDYEAKINEIDFKIKSIDKALSSAIIEDKESIKQQEYKELVNKAVKTGGLNDNELMAEIENYADKYELTNKEFEELKINIENDIWENW